MSATYYAKLIVGSPLHPDALYIPQRTGNKICPKGHGLIHLAFCASCGHAFTEEVTYSWNAAFVDYANKVVKTTESQLFDQWKEAYSAVGFYDVNRYTSSESSGAFYVLGTPIGVVASNTFNQLKEPLVLDAVTLQTEKQLIGDIMDRLNVAYDGPNLYLTMHCSY